LIRNKVVYVSAGIEDLERFFTSLSREVHSLPQGLRCLFTQRCLLHDILENQFVFYFIGGRIEKKRRHKRKESEKHS
jgi:hypothetical protein